MRYNYVKLMLGLVCAYNIEVSATERDFESGPSPFKLPLMTEGASPVTDGQMLSGGASHALTSPTANVLSPGAGAGSLLPAGVLSYSVSPGARAGSPPPPGRGDFQLPPPGAEDADESKDFCLREATPCQDNGVNPHGNQSVSGEGPASSLLQPSVDTPKAEDSHMDGQGNSYLSPDTSMNPLHHPGLDMPEEAANSHVSWSGQGTTAVTAKSDGIPFSLFGQGSAAATAGPDGASYGCI